MTQLNGEQINKLQQVVLVLLAVGIQLVLYFLARSFPYPLFVKEPKFGGLFFFAYTSIFLGSLSSGIALGWRYLPLIALCLSGTTLVPWVFIGILMSSGTLFSRIPINELIKDLGNMLQVMMEEETIPATIWAVSGGMCGSFLNRILGHRIPTKAPFKFLLHITVVSIIIIVIFGVPSAISSSWFLIFAWVPTIFIGVSMGLIVPSKAAVLTAASQTLLGLIVFSWVLLTAHGEGGMIIVPLLFMIPVFVGCGILASLYGTYLRNRFFAKT